MANRKSSTKIATYTRESLLGPSLATQTDAIDSWLDHNRVGSSYIYSDESDTKHPTKTSGIDQLEQAISDGLVTTVLVYRLDRLARSTNDGIERLARWLSIGVRVIAVDKWLDLYGPSAKTFAKALLELAETDQIEQREQQQNQTLPVAVARKTRGRAPGSSKASPTLACELRTKGLSIAAIATELGVSKQTVSRYLKRSL